MRLIVTDGVARPVCRSVTIVSPAKTAEAIEMPFGLWSRVVPRKHVLDGSVYWRHLTNVQLNRSCAAAMRPVVKYTLTSCYCYY